MKSIFASVLLCSSLAAYAEPENSQIGVPSADVDTFDMLFAAGLTFGGEDLISTTGGTSVSSGGLYYLAIGGVFHYSPKFDLQASFGYHFDSVSAENGSADFSRTFIEVLPFYVTDSGNRLGIGFTQVNSPDFTSPFGDVSFDGASGMIIEYDWNLANNSYFGLRYVDLSYGKSGYVFDFDGDGNYEDTIDGSYIGLIVQGNF